MKPRLRNRELFYMAVNLVLVRRRSKLSKGVIISDHRSELEPQMNDLKPGTADLKRAGSLMQPL